MITDVLGKLDRIIHKALVNNLFITSINLTSDEYIQFIKEVQHLPHLDTTKEITYRGIRILEDYD